MSILVVDDEKEVRQVIAAILENEGYEVIQAGDGEEAFSLVKSESSIELVVTDIVMPEKEGIETIREIKRNFPKIKILAMSGGGRSNPLDYLSLAKGLGANETLSKPFLRKDLLEKINGLLNLETKING